MTPVQVLAALGLLVCAALLARQFLGERHRARLDAAVARHGRRLQRAWARWRARRRSAQTPGTNAEREAREEAARIIDEARRRSGTPRATRTGNVVRPERFGNRRNDLH